MNPDRLLVCAHGCRANVPHRDETGCPLPALATQAVLGREPLSAFPATEGDGHRGSGVLGCPQALLAQGLCHACLALSCHEESQAPPELPDSLQTCPEHPLPQQPEPTPLKNKAREVSPGGSLLQVPADSGGLGRDAENKVEGICKAPSCSSSSRRSSPGSFWSWGPSCHPGDRLHCLRVA